MPYLQELLNQQRVSLQQPVGVDLGLPRGAAYSSYYPQYEIQTPQYISPSPYSLAQVGYRTNEVIYALISKRAKAMSDAPLYEYYDSLDDEIEPEEVRQSDIRKLLKRVNQGIGEKMFWQITSIYRDIAGFAAWEIERNRLGEPVRLWIMRPDWCSFLRGEGKPIRAVRYQPYGMPPMDIPIENIYLSGRFDPLYPQIRFYSPTMSALSQIGVDNSMTDFLNDFVKHGAKFSGLLSVAQTIDENTANDYKRRFRDSHGGTQNWSDPLVLGLGAKYESMQMNFRDMAFPELDARTESRICMAFEMSPILISAKVGLDRSTYSNYEQASRAWYNEWVTPEWKIVADTFGEKFLPLYHSDPENYYCEFNVSKVLALQENRSERWKRADMAFRGGWATLNEAREEAGLDPDDDETGGQYYQKATTTVTDPIEYQSDDVSSNALPTLPQKQTEQESDEEIKNFRSFARKRIREGKSGDIPLFEFKFVSPENALELIRAALAEAVEHKLDEVLKTHAG